MHIEISRIIAKNKIQEYITRRLIKKKILNKNTWGIQKRQESGNKEIKNKYGKEKNRKPGGVSNHNQGKWIKNSLQNWVFWKALSICHL